MFYSGICVTHIHKHIFSRLPVSLQWSHYNTLLLSYSYIKYSSLLLFVQDPRCAFIGMFFFNEFIRLMVAAVITLIPFHVGKCGNEVSKLPVWARNTQKRAKSQRTHSLFYQHMSPSVCSHPQCVRCGGQSYRCTVEFRLCVLDQSNPSKVRVIVIYNYTQCLSADSLLINNLSLLSQNK